MWIFADSLQWVHTPIETNEVSLEKTSKIQTIWHLKITKKVLMLVQCFYFNQVNFTSFGQVAMHIYEIGYLGQKSPTNSPEVDWE
jgi:hypothetical protein